MTKLFLTALLLAAGATLTPVGAAPEDKAVSVDLRDAELRQVIDSIMRGTGANYILADEARGKVTARLENMPLRQALDTLLSAAGYEATLADNTYVIRRIPKPETPAKAGEAQAKAPDKPAAKEPPKPAGEAAGGTAPNGAHPEQGNGGPNMPDGNGGPMAMMAPGSGYGPYGPMPMGGYGPYYAPYGPAYVPPGYYGPQMYQSAPQPVMVTVPALDRRMVNGVPLSLFPRPLSAWGGGGFGPRIYSLGY